MNFMKNLIFWGVQLMLFNLLSAQEERLNRIESKLVGTWKFSHAMIDYGFGGELQRSEEYFYFDTIHFSFDKTYSMNTHVRREGTWKLIKRDSVALINHKMESPENDLPDIHFSIKRLSKRNMVMMFPISIVLINLEKRIEKPQMVYFERIE